MSAKLTETEGRCLTTIGAWRAANGCGPEWRRLREQLHLERSELESLLRAAHRRHLVVYTTRAASLDLSPAGRTAVLLWLADRRRRHR